MSELSSLPSYELEYFAKRIVRETEEYFKDPDVQRRFKEWQRERNSIEKDEKQS